MARGAHKLVAKIAKAIAAEDYEQLAHDNKFFAAYPHRRGYVRMHWQHYTGAARNSLITMLGAPDGTYPQSMLDEAYEAVLLDGGINPKKLPGDTSTTSVLH